MTDPMMKINLDELVASTDVKVTPEIRALLEQAYEAGSFEGRVAPIAPGDPAAAEREATQFATAAKTLLDGNETAGKLALRGILNKHLARKA